MTLERRSPLPPGRYWIDVATAEKIQKFNTLMSTAATLGAVVVENVELNGAATDLDRVLEVLTGSKDASAWYLFRVTGVGTLSIDAKTFGFPTIAEDGIHSKDDTVSKPDPVAAANDGAKTLLALAEGLTLIFTLKTILDFVKTFRSKTP